MQDLTDLIGNLLDNAGKWARSRVRITAERDPMLIRRDASISPHASTTTARASTRRRAKQALQRGRRLDESRPGSGLGLSIVVDLAAIYGGSLRLEDSPLGGVRASLRLPSL